MPAFVRTEEDEKHWQEAKRRVREEYGLSEKDGDRFWKIVNGIYQKMSGKKTTHKSAVIPMETFRRWLRKSADPSVAERAWRRQMEITRDLLAQHQVMYPDTLKHARSAEEWEEVERKKEHEYGSGEVFADPEHHSYPLTKDGKPSQKRVRAAWSYIHHPKNAAKYSDGGAAVKRRIRAFARKHFPEMQLEDETEAHP